MFELPVWAWIVFAPLLAAAGVLSLVLWLLAVAIVSVTIAVAVLRLKDWVRRPR